MNIEELAAFLADRDHNIDIAKGCLEEGEMHFIGMSETAWMAVLEAIKDGAEARRDASLHALKENDFSGVAETVCREMILHRAFDHILKSIGGDEK